MKLNTINDVKKIDLDSIKSKNATLYVFEKNNKFFNIKRIFTVKRHNEEDYQRGRHAHIRDQQIVTCPYGSIKFLVSDGKNKKTFLLDSPESAIYVPCYIWTETDYLEKDTIVTVYSSNPYDESSYIRDYDEYLTLVNNQGKLSKK